MSPTSFLRFINRKVGEGIGDYRLILQQWWTAGGAGGVWRDVPMEWDEENQKPPV